MARHIDLLTPDLFEVPVPPRPTPGALAIGLSLRSLLSDALKRSRVSRHEVAVSVGREALETQLGKITQMRDELARQERALKKMLGEQA